MLIAQVKLFCCKFNFLSNRCIKVASLTKKVLKVLSGEAYMFLFTRLSSYDFLDEVLEDSRESVRYFNLLGSKYAHVFYV